MIKICLSQNLETLNAFNTVHLSRKVMDFKVFILSLEPCVSKNLPENDTVDNKVTGIFRAVLSASSFCVGDTWRITPLGD